MHSVSMVKSVETAAKCWQVWRTLPQTCWYSGTATNWQLSQGQKQLYILDFMLNFWEAMDDFNIAGDVLHVSRTLFSLDDTIVLGKSVYWGLVIHIIVDWDMYSTFLVSCYVRGSQFEGMWSHVTQTLAEFDLHNQFVNVSSLWVLSYLYTVDWLTWSSRLSISLSKLTESIKSESDSH